MKGWWRAAIRWSCLAGVVAFGSVSLVLKARAKLPAVTDGPGFTTDGQLRFPARYREWVFLSSGLDMSYTSEKAADHSVFNNVFVNPQAYRAFLQTGLWPDGTVMVLENRGAEGKHSINVRGKTQSAEVMGVEVHAKAAHLEGGWGFYGFDNQVSGKEIAHTESCYSCHQQHAAVDTTFAQFYPTLLETARLKGTFSKAYLKEPALPDAAPVPQARMATGVVQ